MKPRRTDIRTRLSTVGNLSSSCVIYAEVMADLLRVVRRGPTVKNIVDDAIDQCAVIYNVRDSIEESRSLAEQASDERQKRLLAQRGKGVFGRELFLR